MNLPHTLSLFNYSPHLWHVKSWFQRIFRSLSNGSVSWRVAVKRVSWPGAGGGGIHFPSPGFELTTSWFHFHSHWYILCSGRRRNFYNTAHPIGHWPPPLIDLELLIKKFQLLHRTGWTWLVSCCLKGQEPGNSPWLPVSVPQRLGSTSGKILVAVVPALKATLSVAHAPMSTPSATDGGARTRRSKSSLLTS